MKQLNEILEGLFNNNIADVKMTFDRLFFARANETIDMKEGKERTAFVNDMVKLLEENLKPLDRVDVQILRKTTGTFVMTRGKDYIMIFNCRSNKYIEGWEIGNYKTYTELYWTATETYETWKFDNTAKMYLLSDKMPDLSKNEITV